METESNLLVDAFEGSMESWKKDHEELKKNCWAIEDKIAVGIGSFHTIRMIDMQWSRGVQEKRISFDPKVIRFIHSLYTRWLVPCDGVLTALAKNEKSYKVEQSEAFRDCVRTATRRAGVDVEKLIESVEAKSRGEMVPVTEELWNELIAGDVSGRAA